MTEWKLTPIREIALGVYDGPHATPPTADDGPIYLGIDNVTQEGRLDLRSTRRIAEDDFPRWTKRVVPRYEDIVFSYEATLHRYAMIPEGFHGCLGRRMALVRPDTSKINPRWLYYAFLAPEWRSLMEANTLHGATVNRIPIAKFPDFKIRVCPRGTQDRIASVLSAYDDLIENNTRRIGVLEEMARGLHREYSAPFAISTREGWTPSSLGDLVSLSKSTVSPNMEPDTEFDLFSFEACDLGRLPIATMGAKIQSNKFRVSPGVVLLPKLNPHIPRVWLPFLEGDRPKICSTEFLVLLPREGIPRSWIYATLESSPFTAELAQRADGTSNSHKRLKPDDVLKRPVLVPPSETLQRFDMQASLLYEQCHVLRRRNHALRAARDLLLPKLLSGELSVDRIPDPAAVAP